MLIEGIGKAHCKHTEPTLTREDFSQYTKQGIPACFFFVGTKSEETDYTHHHPHFDINKQSIQYAMKELLNIAQTGCI